MLKLIFCQNYIPYFYTIIDQKPFPMEAVAGNCGDAIRSDCFVSLALTGNSGIQINLKSKVRCLYGASILRLINEILQFYDIRNASVTMEDSGALPYVIAARMEATIRQLIQTGKEFLLPVLPRNIYRTGRNSLRRSRLYIPGNNPKLIINAGLYKSDGIILDLEDSVSPEKKQEARILVRNALRNNDLMGAEKMVRINRLPGGIEDLKQIINQPLNLVLIPKCESAAQVREVDDVISRLSRSPGEPVWLMPIIESACGIIHAFDIATATGNVAALAIGLEDYTADIGVHRTSEGLESLYARSVLVNAARAAGIQPIDSVFSDFADNEELSRVASKSRSMGFEGMGCIHPGQIRVIHETFNPTSVEIEKARIIVSAFEKAKSEGLGVVSVGSKMIDPPVVKSALNTIERAAKCGLLN